MKDALTTDCGGEYEPEYDLAEAHRQNIYAYKTCTAFRTLVDRLLILKQVTRWLTRPTSYPDTEKECQ